MACKKNTASVIVLSLLILLALGEVSQAIDPDWISLTSQRDVRSMRITNDTLYMATSGGILAVTGSSDTPITYTNLDGLGTVDITNMIIDAEGQKWVTGFGRLVQFEGADSRQYLFFDNDNNLFRLLSVVDDGDFLWVGTEVGLVLFSKTADGGQIEDSYGLFGDLSAEPLVNDILLQGDTIWLATSSGVAVSDKSVPNLLKSPANWTVFGATEYPELGTGEVSRIVSFESEIYIATENGLLRIDRSPTDTTLAMIPIGQNASISDIVVQNDTLFVYFQSGFGAIKDGAASVLPTAGMSSVPTTGMSLNGVRWLNVAGVAVYHDANGTFTEYPFTGAPGNNVSDITVNRDGLITAGFSGALAAHYLDGVWYRQNFTVGERTTALATDSSGNAWVGTFGNGLWVITDTGVVNYDENNSALRGNSDRPPAGLSYVVIHGAATDSRFIYLACYRAVDGNPVVFGELDNINSLDGWGSIGTSEGITDAFVSSLDYANGFIAVGTESNGIFRCFVGNNPFDTDDYECTHYTESTFRLISNDVRTVKFAPDGLLWAGTTQGLAFFDPLASQEGRFVDVTLPEGFGPDIRALEFDSRGAVWIGSSNGLAFIDDATGESVHYTTINSGLISDDVRNLTYDPATGDVYVSTTSGISIIPSMTGTPTPVLDSVVAFPNPFVIRSDDDRLSFNFAGNGTISIYSVAGELVAEFPVGASWDGRNGAGEQVASGVYLYVISDTDSNVGRGKFLLVRGQ